MTPLTAADEHARKMALHGHTGDMLPPEMSDAELDAIDREKLRAATRVVRKYLPRLIAWALIFGAIALICFSR